MLTIRLVFAAGRYHATPWGRHVNEGVAEWPPSPYRLVRALYDVWQRKCSDLREDQVRSVLEALASSAPRFMLPKAVAAHTRSYLNANTKDPTDKNLVFDPFLVLDPVHACYLTWPEVSLDEQQASTLDRLLRELNYLGRSESWVQAERWRGKAEGDIVCHVAEGSDATGQTRIACAVTAADYTGKAPWMDALTFSTANLIRDKDKVSAPPAMRYVSYVLPSEAVVTDPPARLDRRPVETRYVMLGLDSTVLPLVTKTVEVAEQIRVRLMGAHKKRVGDPSQVSPLFSGKTPDGRMRLDHGHLYILPLGNDKGRIDRVLLYSPLAAFTRDELDAVRGVRELWQSDGRPKVACVETWQGAAMRLPEFAEVRVVESAIPFVPPRHRHNNCDIAAYLESEVRRECEHHRVRQPVRVETSNPPSLFEAVEYRRNRRGDPVRPGFFLRLTFDESVPVPFAIGYGAHFGLGMFRRVR
ncbi:MAG TPA: type I-U CRISPR-associated protein Csb2 [Bryobacteraceae bacterium]|nr:type I-U CRISPR-associated protein Csb2 [Bryobacteraceae bacterium]